MGCENSKIVGDETAQGETRPSSRRQKVNPQMSLRSPKQSQERKVYPPGKAFVVNLNGQDEPKMSDYKDERATAATPALVKKPPKRLQELIDRANTTDHSLKLEDLEEKLNRAEQRRQQFIRQKISSASPRKSHTLDEKQQSDTFSHLH